MRCAAGVEHAGANKHHLAAAASLVAKALGDPARDTVARIGRAITHAVTKQAGCRTRRPPASSRPVVDAAGATRAAFLYQLWVREFGTNNLPDCSNLCHEASGGALTAALDSSNVTFDLRDWEQADAIWLIGDNAATNAPRMLTWLAEAARRGAQLVHINPLIEAA